MKRHGITILDKQVRKSEHYIAISGQELGRLCTEKQKKINESSNLVQLTNKRYRNEIYAHRNNQR